MNKLNYNGPYRILKSKNIYKNPWINVREDTVIHPRGNKGIFGIIKMKNGISVLAINSRKEAFLVREYKYGIRNFSTETMSGGMDGNESPLQAAKRELKEELGLVAKRWICLGYVDPFTTILSSKNYMYLALDIKQKNICPDEEEKIELIKVSFKRAVEMVMSGKITHSASCVLILKAEKFIKNKI